MKIGCDACGRAEAAVLCCADEAALCRRCDAAVHSANRLAGRHSRVALLPSTAIVDGSGSHPTCDICQEKTGYFFCLEDRALLCRPCDVAVHAAGAHVASHRRFLITGVRVGGGVGAVSPSTSSGNGSSSAPSSSGNPRTMPDKARPSTSASAAAATEGLGGQQWPWSDFLADDVGVGMDHLHPDLCCPAEISEPGSSSLTG
ncbi:B-box zinc finger protein 23-like [Panicum virgatum]|uniref:B box-type domain-containing protein n=1 Tax=Panicum virgatum TaxID=38727 RepID=A0A8T0UMU4_PANVG|nr:B-box zinc finger protein 23-like [Panicum virgatum]KAG2623488.1 hypothetical protein PVAP13_3KG063700 [Panicum virgatum]